MPGIDLFSNNLSNTSAPTSGSLGNSPHYADKASAFPSSISSSTSSTSSPPSKQQSQNTAASRDFESRRHAFPSELAAKFYHTFKSFLYSDDPNYASFDHASSIADDAVSTNSDASEKARETIKTLVDTQLRELCADVYDELKRRNERSKYEQLGREAGAYFQQAPPSALPNRAEYNDRRNKARNGLSSMSAVHFRVLIENIVNELQKRYPTLTLHPATHENRQAARYATSTNTSNLSNNANSPQGSAMNRSFENAFSGMQLANSNNEQRLIYPSAAAPPIPTSPKKPYIHPAGTSTGFSSSHSSDTLYNSNGNYPATSTMNQTFSSNQPFFTNRTDPFPRTNNSYQNATSKNGEERQSYDSLNQRLAYQESLISEYKERIEKMTRSQNQLLQTVEQLARQLEVVAKDEYGFVQHQENLIESKKQRLREINELLQNVRK